MKPDWDYIVRVVQKAHKRAAIRKITHSDCACLSEREHEITDRDYLVHATVRFPLALPSEADSRLYCNAYRDLNTAMAAYMSIIAKESSNAE